MLPEFSPRWLNHFMKMCVLLSEMSKDPSTKVGSVIVRPNRTICSTGYNGFPRGCRDYSEYYHDRELKLQRVIHAEMNAILHSREPLNGYVLFSWPLPPCDRCMPHIIQSGIKYIIRPPISPSQPWFLSASNAIKMAEEAGLHVGTWEVQ